MLLTPRESEYVYISLVNRRPYLQGAYYECALESDKLPEDRICDVPDHSMCILYTIFKSNQDSPLLYKCYIAKC